MTKILIKNRMENFRNEVLHFFCKYVGKTLELLEIDKKPAILYNCLEKIKVNISNIGGNKYGKN